MKNTELNRLLVKVARLYYEEQLTQQEIAERLRLSRQKVQRLVNQAHKQGIVQITIRPLLATFADQEKALEDRFGLQEAVIVETTNYHDQTIVAREVGIGAAQTLLRIVQPRDRIVISWGGTLLGMVNALYSMQAAVDDLLVIQGLGGLVAPNNEVHAAELTRRMANALGGQAMLLPAPGVAGSPQSCTAFYQDPYVRQTLDQAQNANLCFMGIGAPRPDSILVREGNIVTWAELGKLIEGGVVGDINLRYFDENGRAVTSDLDERVIGLDLGQIQQIDRVVGLAGGAAKFKAVQAALKGQLIDVLVTDHITTQKLLEN